MAASRLAPLETAPRGWLPGLLLAVLVLRVFWPVVGFEFLYYDDRANFHNNPLVSEPTAGRLLRTWTEAYLGIYVPLTTTLWAGLAASTQLFSGERFPTAFDAFAFHALNLVLHLGCVWLVFRLLTRALGAPSPAAAGAAVWALHPLVVESVAWASETKGLWSAWWGLVCLGQYQRAWGAAGDFRRVADGTLGVSRWRLVWAALAYLLCVLAKPSGIVILPMLALWHVVWLGMRYRVLAGWLACAVLPTMVVMALASGEQADSYPALLVSPVERPLVALDSWGFYLRKLVWPFHLGPDYGRMPQLVVDLPHALAAVATLAAGFALVACAAGVRRAVLAGGWFLLSTLPVVGLVPFRFQEYSTVADRYVYLGLLGPAWLVAWWLSQPSRARLRWSVALPVLVGLAVLTTRQLRVWRNDHTLGTQALAVNPDSVLGPTWLAMEEKISWLLSNRDSDDRRRAEELRWWHQAAAVRPVRPVALYNLGAVYAERGEWALAVTNYREAVRLYPRFAGARSALSSAYQYQGRYDLAIATLRHLVADCLATSADHEALARILWYRKDYTGARKVCLAGLALDPSSDDLSQLLEMLNEQQRLRRDGPRTARDWERLAWLQMIQGRLQETAATCRAGLQIAPDSRELQQLLRIAEQDAQDSGS